jgi:hypothetical protein
VPVIILVSFRNLPWGWATFFVFASSLCQVILHSWNVLSILLLAALENAARLGNKSQNFMRDERVLASCEFISGCVWTIGSFLILEGQIILGFVALVIEACVMAIAYRRNLQLGDIWGI